MSIQMLIEQEIGGYFGLNLPFYGDSFPGMIKYQSARAALRAVLEHLKATELLLPNYICDSVIQAVIDSNVRPIFYSLDDQLFPKNLPVDKSRRYLLYVNYFGLNDCNISELSNGWPKSKLIIDNSQALFAQPSDAIATIYSPRKFLGVPDGGILYAPCLLMTQTLEEDTSSIDKMRHLILRTAYSAKAGYSDYLAAEKNLQNTKPLGMSQLTRRLISSNDLEQIREVRVRNFYALESEFNKINTIDLQLSSKSAPLCYPLSLYAHDADKLRFNLLTKNIYIPSYWDDVKKRAAIKSIEMKLTTNTLYLPCDQRYQVHDIQKIIDAVRGEM